MNTEPDAQLFGRIADRLKSMADPTRLRILYLLKEKDRCVSELLADVGGSQANLSKHLARMRMAGIVEAHREGTNVYYRVADPEVFAICRTVCDGLERQVEATRSTLRGGRKRIGAVK